MTQRTIILVVTLFLTALLPHANAQKTTPTEAQTELYRQGMDLFGKQKYAAAQHIFDQAANNRQSQNDLATADACYYAAVCSERLDNDDAAFRLEQFLRLYPQSNRCNMARFYLGNFYYSRTDLTRALSYYREVVPNEIEYGHRAEYNFKTAYCLFDAGRYKEASSLFAQQVGGRSKYASSSLYYYAHIQYMQGEYESSLRNFRELQQDKRFARIVPSYIARIYYYLGREDELLQMAPQLLQDEETFRRNEIHQMIGQTYFNRGEYARALEQYRANADADADRCTPQDNDYQIGYCHYQLGNYDSAATYLVRKTTCDDSVAQNALYLLADCYLKTNRKSEARSIFLQASTMKHDPKIKEEALFNYAKLGCELKQNPYNESIHSFENYLKSYPKTKHRTEIQEILTSLYCTTKNYKDAITMLEKIPQRNSALEQAYQRAVINRGVELMNQGELGSALEHFDKAVKINAVPKMTTDASYLSGETSYRQGRYAAADKSLTRFINSSFSRSSAYALPARYTYGYLKMKQKHYDDAQEAFEQLLALDDGSLDRTVIDDANNRLGDCHYINSHYDDAIRYYTKVIDSRGRDADYATYQKAMAYGAQGRNSEKLTYLNYIFERFDNSPLSSKAMLEIANTYLAFDNNEMAMTYYTNFVKKYPRSAYVKNALLSMGLIYYNTERDEQALQTFDRLLTNYPGTDEARDALAAIKNIYMAQNRVDEYFAYVGRATNVAISTAEQDSTTFLAVETRYDDGQYSQAAEGFERYLKKFPKGLFALKARYYLADSYMHLGRPEDALPLYQTIAAGSKNSYTERSIAAAAEIAYNLQNYATAKELYTRLATEAESAASRLQGHMGMVRTAAALTDHNLLMKSGRTLLADTKATVENRDEALVLMSRSCFDNNMLDSAYTYYSNLTSSANGEYSGEALCRQAEIQYLRHNYDQSEAIIKTIINDASSDYWLAYAFIIWADIYKARGNNLQAKQTLQSIIDNYDGDELVKIATERLNAIAAEENRPQPTGDDEIIIEL
ncbi:MAG: tetratricopeptide repeat protein [Bacteroidales bacterium]|nr:tetratricopeptide repeat protein [Bacteroidales bacterium]